MSNRLVEKMTLRFDHTWNLMLMAITLSALATSAMAESDSKKEKTEDCATAAMTDYGKAKRCACATNRDSHVR